MGLRGARGCTSRPRPRERTHPPAAVPRPWRSGGWVPAAVPPPTAPSRRWERSQNRRDPTGVAPARGPGDSRAGGGRWCGQKPPNPAVLATFAATAGHPVYARERRSEVTPRPAGPDPRTASRRKREPRTSLSTDAAPVLRPWRRSRIPPRPPAPLPRAARDPPRPPRRGSPPALTPHSLISGGAGLSAPQTERFLIASPRAALIGSAWPRVAAPNPAALGGTPAPQSRLPQRRDAPGRSWEPHGAPLPPPSVPRWGWR